MSHHEYEMDDLDDDIMDEGAEFDISQNAELNDDLMPEINESEKKKVVGLKKKAACWKHFTPITREGHPKPRAACNWCGTYYACHSKLNVALESTDKELGDALGLRTSTRGC